MDRFIIKEIQQEHKGNVHKFPLGVLAKNVETDSGHKFLTEKEIKELKEKLGPMDSVSNNTVNFENVENIKVLLQSGTKLGKLFPQINVWLSNLGTAAWKGVSNSTNVTADGYVADARALKAVNDKLGGISFEREGENVYAVYKNGADTVRKKLGDKVKGVEWYLECEGRRDGTNTDGEDTRYGWISWFDISSVLPDYSELTVGRDFFIIPASFGSLGGTNGLKLSLPFGRQVNISSGIDVNNWRASHDLENEKHYLTEENRTGGIPVICLFAPSAGKVYVMTSLNAYIGNIAIIRSDIG